jgi:glycine dehydrogenase subunit 1
MRRLRDALAALKGVTPVFARPFFHETVLRFDADADAMLARLADDGILGGYSLKQDYPELGECVLACATETKTPADLERYAQACERALVRG